MSKSSSERSTPLIIRNPQTTARFKSESWWQILFPMLGITLLLLGGVAALAVVSGPSSMSVVADYSIILLCIPTLVVGLPSIIIWLALSGLVEKGIRYIPPRAYAAHKQALGIQKRVEAIANGITGGIMAIQAVVTGFIRFLRERGYSVDDTDAASGKTEMDTE